MENINAEAIIQRIRELRTDFAGQRGKSEFARALGISPSTYNYYEQDRIPPVETLLNICQLTGTDLHWLLTGKSASSTEGLSPTGKNTQLINNLNLLLKEHPDTARAISAFIDLLREKTDIETSPKSSEQSPMGRKPGWIPILGRTAAGIVHCWGQNNIPEPAQAITKLETLVKQHTGKDILRRDKAPVTVDVKIDKLSAPLDKNQVNLVRVRGDEQSQIFEFVECEQICSIFPDSFALHIDGDSMSPRINDGDIVIASPSVAASDGQVAIAHIANQIGVTCKLIRTSRQQVHLIPINERYETKVVPQKDLLWSLAVLCHISI